MTITPDAWQADMEALRTKLMRAEAQSEARRLQTAYWQERAAEMESSRDEWRQTALDERGATVDLLEQIKIRDARIEAARDVAKLMSQSHMRGWVGSCGDEILEALEG